MFIHLLLIKHVSVKNLLIKKCRIIFNFIKIVLTNISTIHDLGNMITIYSAITFFYSIFIQSEYFQNGYEIVQLQFRKYYLKVNMALLLGEITLFLSKGVVWSSVRFKKLKLISALFS